MAERVPFICNTCGHRIESWSDGNPYYFESVVTKTGKVKQQKKYAYYPDHELLARCVGNDSSRLCLSCGENFMVDSEKPITACRKCKSGDIVDTYELAGKPCPYCEGGVFGKDESIRWSHWMYTVTPGVELEKVGEVVLESWMDSVENETGHKPNETDLYTEAKVSRGWFAIWKEGKAGDKVGEAISDAMRGKWEWKKLEGEWKVTIDDY